MWVMEFMKAYNWPLAITLIVISAFLRFRKPIEKAIENATELYVKHGASELGVRIVQERIVATGAGPEPEGHVPQAPQAAAGAGPEAAAPAAGQDITEQDVTREFLAVPGLSEEYVRRDAKEALDQLRRSNIRTPGQLHELAASSEIASAIRKLYKEELRRPEERSLDPMAMAAWGSILYTYGVDDATVEAIRRRIRQFPEYKALPRTR